MLLVRLFYKEKVQYFLRTWTPVLLCLIPYLAHYGLTYRNDVDEYEFGLLFGGVTLILLFLQCISYIPFLLRFLRCGSTLKKQINQNFHLNHTILITKEYFIFYGMFRKICISIHDIYEYGYNEFMVENLGRGAFSRGVSLLTLKLKDGKNINIELDHSLHPQEVSEVLNALSCALDNEKIVPKMRSKLPSKSTPRLTVLVLGIVMYIVACQVWLQDIMKRDCVGDSQEVWTLYYVAYIKQYTIFFYLISFLLLVAVLAYIIKKMLFFNNTFYLTFIFGVFSCCFLYAMTLWPMYDNATIHACKQDYLEYKDGKGLNLLPDIKSDSYCEDEKIRKIIRGIDRYSRDRKYYFCLDTKEYFWAIVPEGTDVNPNEFRYYFENTHLMMR